MAKAGGAQRESEGVVVVVIGVQKRKGRNLRAGEADAWTPDWLHAHGLHRLMGTIRYPGAA